MVASLVTVTLPAEPAGPRRRIYISPAARNGHDSKEKRASPVTATLVPVAVVVGTGAALLLLWELRRIAIWCVVSMFLAVVLSRPVGAAERRLRLPRALAVLVVLVGLTIAVAGLAVLIVQPLWAQRSGLPQSFDQYVTDATQGTGAVGRTLQRLHLDGWARSHGPELRDSFAIGDERLLAAARSMTDTVVALLTITVLTVVMLIESPRLWQAALGLCPEGQRERLQRVLDDCSRSVGGYVAGNLLISVIAGLVAFCTLWIQGVPFAAPLALWVAVADLIPLVGAFLGGAAAVVVALLHSVPAGIATLVVVLVYQQFENHVLQVAVMSRTVQLNPLLVLISVLSGAQLAGIVGALLAIPVTGVLQVVGLDLWQERQRRRGRGGNEAAQRTA